MSGKLPVYVGTYTETIHFFSGKILEARGKGIYQLSFEPDRGVLEHVAVIEGVRNPSYLVRSRSGEYLYCANEAKETDGKPGGAVSAFSVDRASGSLTFINSRHTDGDDPCYIETDAEGSCVYATNFGSGSVGVFPVRSDGGLAPHNQLIQHTGSSVHPKRQTRAFAHAAIVSPDGRFVYIPDLGMDKIVAYARDKQDGRLTHDPDATAAVAPGTGPRHAEFHPNGRRLYVINELSCTLSVFEHDAATGRLHETQTIPSLIIPYDQDKTCADIHITPDGRFVYGTTRAANRILCCRIDPASGLMDPVAEYSTEGGVPRNFAIAPDGRHLLVANQNTDNMVIFSINPESGKLTPKSSFALPSPVCIKIYAST